MSPVNPDTIAHRVRVLIPPGPRDAASALTPRSSPHGPQVAAATPEGSGRPNHPYRGHQPDRKGHVAAIWVTMANQRVGVWAAIACAHRSTRYGRREQATSRR